MATKPAAADKTAAPAHTTSDAQQKDVGAECETGGLSKFLETNDKIKAIVGKVKTEINEKLKLLTKEKLPKDLEIVGYRVIVVRGFMYFAKIKIPGNSFVHAKILETPEGEVTLYGVHETKTEADEIEYFKLPSTTTDAQQKDMESEYETGGLSNFREADDKIRAVVEKVHDEITEKIKLLTKEKVPKNLEVVGYRMNVVLGFMYYAKIKIPGNSFVQAKILETPSGEITLHSVYETKTAEDEREYFKLPVSK